MPDYTEIRVLSVPSVSLSNKVDLTSTSMLAIFKPAGFLFSSSLSLGSHVNVDFQL